MSGVYEIQFEQIHVLYWEIWSYSAIQDEKQIRALKYGYLEKWAIAEYSIETKHKIF